MAKVRSFMAGIVGACWFAGFAYVACQEAATANTRENAGDTAEFFEKRVRPVLAENCFSCHGEELQMAGLRLDSRQAILKGRENGHIVVKPGDPENSPLIRAIRHRGEIKMPPTGRLSEEEIQVITEWVRMGVPWPEEAATAPNSDAREFFEEHIRPILVDRCYACHTDSASGGFRLDSRESLLRGGSRGPAIIPGKPEESLLIRAVSRIDSNLMMPLVGEKLSDQEIANLKAWISMGAPWPESSLAQAGRKIGAQTKVHWSFQPVKASAIPEVKNEAWVKTPVDAFILAKLENKALAPSPPADPRALIRRAYYDLIGLPPTPKEVEAFRANPSPEAFAEIVDRLLTSPQYGERWGRHWLDVARYGETKGYTTVGLPEELRYPFAYTYRDWVIRAFNEDIPYDQFLTYQIAADYLVKGEDKRDLAALGFLTLGRRVQNNIHEIIDDRLDVVFRGTQALTIGCARCHDHKYDPIPTKDYYSLYGVFASTEEKTLPLVASHTEVEPFNAFERERQTREKKMKEFLKAKRAALLPRFRQQVGEYLVAAHAAEMLRVPANAIKLHLVMVERWRSYLEKTRQEFHPVFGPWNAFATLLEQDFAAKAPALAAEFSSGQGREKRANPLVAKLFAGRPPNSLQEVAERYGRLFNELDVTWKSTAEPRTDPAEEELRQVLYGQDSPTNVPEEATKPGQHSIATFLDEPSHDELDALKRSLLRWSFSASAPPHALVLVDAPEPNKPRVFIRGKPDTLGEEVPRQFLVALVGAKREPFKQGSGRLELARAIANRHNPLTARVLVNRVWLWLFGAGLVRTPSDFGLRSEPPSHSELLDYLAQRFMDEGWSVKKLVRLIVLSSVYQQSSEDNPQHRLVDPENRLLWRMNRRRLDFESLRDSLLFASGNLDTKMGGRSVDLTEQPFSGRRTVYGFIDRDNLPAMMRAFDFAAPETHSPQRINTTVPQQALFMMNSPFVIEQARSLAKRAEVGGPSDTDSGIRSLYRVVFQRDPSSEEIMLAQRFLGAGKIEGPESAVSKPQVWYYGFGEFDEQAKRVRSFEPFPHWTGESWQGGSDLPVPKLGRALLKAEEGHPGPDAQHAVIRRWVAPRDGEVSIVGTLTQPPSFATAAIAGDGVRGRIISSRWGELGSWLVHNGFTETSIEQIEVKRGDTLDFVVDCRTNPYYDSFAWAPTIRLVEPPQKEAAEEVMEWSAANDFAGPSKKIPEALTSWEKYAQVLMMSNEFIFLD